MIPNKLKKGDTIAVIAPSNTVFEDDIQYLKKTEDMFKREGINVIYGKNIYIIITICGIFWEVITPMYKKESVCDIFDFIMYILGASIYLIIIRGWKKWKKIN